MQKTEVHMLAANDLRYFIKKSDLTQLAINHLEMVMLHIIQEGSSIASQDRNHRWWVRLIQLRAWMSVELPQ